MSTHLKVRVNAELHTACGLARVDRGTDCPRAVACVLVQAVLLVDAASAVAVTEVQPVRRVTSHELCHSSF